MAKNTYSEKLKDPRWQKKRLQVLERDNWTCTICGDKDTTLHIHHKKYAGDPWEVSDEDLQTLCEDCHYLKAFERIDSPLIKVMKYKVDWGIYYFFLIVGDAVVVFFAHKDERELSPTGVLDLVTLEVLHQFVINNNY